MSSEKYTSSKVPMAEYPSPLFEKLVAETETRRDLPYADDESIISFFDTFETITEPDICDGAESTVSSVRFRPVIMHDVITDSLQKLEELGMEFGPSYCASSYLLRHLIGPDRKLVKFVKFFFKCVHYHGAEIIDKDANYWPLRRGAIFSGLRCVVPFPCMVRPEILPPIIINAPFYAKYCAKTSRTKASEDTPRIETDADVFGEGSCASSTDGEA